LSTQKLHLALLAIFFRTRWKESLKYRRKENKNWPYTKRRPLLPGDLFLGRITKKRPGKNASYLESDQFQTNGQFSLE
jgi:hypothetical protein